MDRAGRGATPRAPAPEAAGPGPRAAPRADAGLPDRLQAGPPLGRVLPGAHAAQCDRRGWRAGRGPSPRDGRGGRRRAADGHVGVRDGLLRDRDAVRDACRGACRAAAVGRVGREPGRSSRHDRGGLPQPLPDPGAEHWPGALVGGADGRGADRPRRERGPRDAGAAAGGRRADADGAGGMGAGGGRDGRGDGLDERLHVLVPGRDGAQRGDLAGLGARLPEARRAVRPGRLPLPSARPRRRRRSRAGTPSLRTGVAARRADAGGPRPRRRGPRARRAAGGGPGGRRTERAAGGGRAAPRPGRPRRPRTQPAPRRRHHRAHRPRAGAGAVPTRHARHRECIGDGRQRPRPDRRRSRGAARRAPLPARGRRAAAVDGVLPRRRLRPGRPRHARRPVPHPVSPGRARGPERRVPARP